MIKETEKGFEEFRKGKEEKFRETPVMDRKHGLGISTKLGWLNLDSIKINENHNLILEHETYEKEGKIKVFEGKEIEQANLPEIEKIKELFFESFKNSLGLKEKIEYLHEAVSKPTLVYIPEDVNLKETVFLRKLLKGNCFSHTFIYVGKNSKANLFYKVFNEGEGIGTEFTNLYLDEGSALKFVNHKDLKDDYYLHSKNLQVTSKDSSLKLTTADFGGKLIVNETLVRLQGRNSSAYTNNIYYTHEGEEYDLSCTSEHVGKDSYSLLNSKGTVKSAKALIRGLVRITKPAFESNGYQQSDALLLDDNAKIISIPDLEIHNDQVKCSHGSTISRLEEEKIFYMKSRGISESEAEKQLIEGFYTSVLEGLNEESRNIIKEKIVGKIK